MPISHVVVEELLQLLVDKVDGDLLEAVVLKDLETGDVKHSTEVGLFLRKISDKQVRISIRILHPVIDECGVRKKREK